MKQLISFEDDEENWDSDDEEGDDEDWDSDEDSEEE